MSRFLSVISVFATLTALSPSLLADDLPAEKPAQFGAYSGFSIFKREFKPLEDVDPSGSGATHGAFTVGVNGALHFTDLFDAEGNFLLMPAGQSTRYEFTASGGAVYVFKLQELYIAGPSNGPDSQTSVLFGPGFARPLPGKLIGKLTVSIGAAYLEWLRPHLEEKQSIAGAYLGGNLILRVWKLQNKLRLAFYLAPNPNAKEVKFTGPGVSEAWNSASKGFLGEDELVLPVLSKGPVDVRSKLGLLLRQLPDGTEWRGTIGIEGRVGY